MCRALTPRSEVTNWSGQELYKLIESSYPLPLAIQPTATPDVILSDSATSHESLSEGDALSRVGQTLFYTMTTSAPV